MTSSIAVVLALAMFVGNGAMGAPVSPADQAIMVAAHNAARGAVGAIDMEAMVWDDALAASAQIAADRCSEVHSGMPGVGENLSWGWPTMTPSAAILEWTNEKIHYSYETNECIGGVICGHYTQLMWAQSAKVGCAVKTCANLLSQPQVDSWVCHYSPVGNIKGEKPYKVGGAACSSCPAGKSACQAGMCVAPGASPSAPAVTTAPAATAAPGATVAPGSKAATATPTASGAAPATPTAPGAAPAGPALASKAVKSTATIDNGRSAPAGNVTGAASTPVDKAASPVLRPVGSGGNTDVTPKLSPELKSLKKVLSPEVVQEMMMQKVSQAEIVDTRPSQVFVGVPVSKM